MRRVSARRWRHAVGSLGAALAMLVAAGAVRAAEGAGEPAWLRQSVRLDLASAPAGAEAVGPAPARPQAARRLRELAARLRGRAGEGPGVWYERRAVYLGVRSRF